MITDERHASREAFVLGNAYAVASGSLIEWLVHAESRAWWSSGLSAGFSKDSLVRRGRSPPQRRLTTFYGRRGASHQSTWLQPRPYSARLYRNLYVTTLFPTVTQRLIGVPSIHTRFGITEPLTDHVIVLRNQPLLGAPFDTEQHIEMFHYCNTIIICTDETKSWDVAKVGIVTDIDAVDKRVKMYLCLMRRVLIKIKRMMFLKYIIHMDVETNKVIISFQKDFVFKTMVSKRRMNVPTTPNHCAASYSLTFTS